MKLQTAVSLGAPPSPLIDHQMTLLSMGSCFSEHIGRRLADIGFRIEVNPFGIQYNPLSIARGLYRLLAGQSYQSDELITHNGLYHSLDHHGSFSSYDPDVTLERINMRYAKARTLLDSASYLLLTWGTAYVYHLANTGQVVNNCHKLPERTFERRRITLPELIDYWAPLLDRLLSTHPRLHIIQTVSPIRHLRDGAHANQLSKATLLLFAEELCQRYPDRIFYFPAYEIVQDELRDYRFYAEDMTHPSAQTVQYIARQFISWACTPDSQELGVHIDRLRQSYQHRPLQGDHPDNLLHREQLLLRIKAFLHSHPHVCLDSWLNTNDL